MNWKIGMYLLFQTKVGKITKIFNSDKVSMRVFSKGNTERGYHYQLKTNTNRLDKQYRDNKVRVIKSYDEILACLYHNFQCNMPIRNVNNVDY